jgi:hypothetical protein
MKKIITLIQKNEWIYYVQKSLNHDFYHTWTYHFLDNNGVPLLFVYEEGEDFIAFPLIKRNIPETNLYDFSSVYGYSGPISNKNFKELDESFINRFKNRFLSYLSAENIVSIFSRLHPFFDQEFLLQKFGGVWDNGKIIAIDLNIPLEEQRSRYQNRVLRQIKQMNRKGYKVRQASTLEDINIFKEMYTASMLRLDASQSYIFNDQYYTDLLNSKELDAKLLFVYNENDIPICGAIVVFTNKIIQAHLLATKQEYYAESPAKLLTDEIAILGRSMGMKYYNLGGGLGFKEDSLFNWKSAFSKLTFQFNSWRFIANHTEYQNILDEFDINPETIVDLFPLYRSTLQKIG